MKSMTLTIAIILVAVLSMPVLAQDEDLGARDSILITMTYPSVNGNDSTFLMEVYFFNDSNRVVSGSVGFTWENEHLILDSAALTPLADSVFDFSPFLYYMDDIDTSNYYDLCQCAVTRLSGSGLAPSSSPQKVATFWFRLSSWSVEDVICFDSATFSGGTNLMFVDSSGHSYAPYFAGRQCVCDLSTDADSDGIGDACDECTDTDGDGYGNPDIAANTCPPDNCPSVYNPDQTDNDGDGFGAACDCDDADTTVYPGAPELCDGQINDCDTASLPAGETDDDGDLYVECTVDTGGWDGDSTTVGGGDCNDTNAVINPATVWYYDADSDGHGDHSVQLVQCAQPTGYVFDSSDNCPAVANSNQADYDNDGIGDACDSCTDADRDGYGEPGFPASTCRLDNCPAAYNPGQEDSDFDGVGDACCCSCRRLGNVDRSRDCLVTMSDLTVLIDHLFITLTPLPACP